MNFGEMSEMAEIGSLGAVRRRKQKCAKGLRKVKRPDGVFVCIPKKPCAPGYKFNVKQFKCLMTAKLRRQQTGGPTAPPGFFPGGTGPGGFLPDGSIGVEPGFDDTGIPGNVYVPPGGGQGPVAIDPLTGQPYPGQFPSNQINPWTGQPYPFTGSVPPGQQPSGPSGPSALYPYGGGGGFQQPFGGAMPGAPVQFDTAGGGADFGDGGGSDDFIPNDAQMNLTPPGIPQQYGAPSPYMPGMPEVEGGEMEAASEEFQSGGTEEAAYQPEEGGMEGLGEGAVPPLANTIIAYRDIALDTAKTLRDEFGKPRRDPKPKPDPEVSNVNTWLLIGLAAGVGFLAYKYNR